MKKILLVAFVAMAMGVNAQIEAGKLMIGGSLGFSTSGGSTENTVGGTTVTTEGAKGFNFNFLPQVGYFLNENMAFGAGLGYEFSKTSWKSDFMGEDRDYYSKEGIMNFAPFARYYKSTGDHSFAFGEFAIPLGFGSRNSNDWDTNTSGDAVEVENDPTKVFNLGVHLSLGFNYFLNDKCALEAKWAALQFNSSSLTTEGDGYSSVNKSNSFGLGFDMTAFTIGLKVFM